MTPRSPGAALVSVLGAQPSARRALIQALQARLRARGAASLHLPCVWSRQALEYSAGLQPQAQALLNDALAREGVVLSESSTVHAAAMASAATPEQAGAAAAELARSTLVLLCAPAAQEAAEVQALYDRLRELLIAARASFSVVHGTGPAAHAQAEQALCLALGWPLDAAAPESATARTAAWRSPCDKCSDPGCEHRIFSDLVASRVQACA